MSVAQLKAQTVTPSHINELDRARMYSIMQKYYDSMSRTQFLVDLDGKHSVILLRDDQETIQGFSTLLKRNLDHDGRKIIGLFSGDTIIEKEFWGQKALGVEFLKYLWLEKVKNPLTPVYWFLISKGYKTYLMMANNFTEHYPRYEKPTPPSIKKLMDEFYTSLYPNKYHPESGRILFEVCEGKLKNGVADTYAELTQTNLRASFFEQKNPHWSRGDELACVARMTFWMPLKYQFKLLMKSQKAIARGTPTYSGVERRSQQVEVVHDRRKSRRESRREIG